MFAPPQGSYGSAIPVDGSHGVKADNFGNFSNEMPAIGQLLGLGGMGGGLSKENFGNFSNGMPTLQRSFRAMKGRGFGDGPVRTRGPESLAGQESGLLQATGGRIDRSQINQPRQPIKLGGFNPSGMFGRSTIQPQQRGGMFNQQNQFNPQGMQQMMQFMQQMMQMFSAMGGQNRGGGFGGGFGGQQQYQQPQRYQPQQYQPQERTLQQHFQPVQQQYGQMGPQQPSPFAQSIRPRY